MPEIPIYKCKFEQTGTIEIPHVWARTKEEAANVIKPYIQNDDREHLIALYLGPEINIIGVETIGIGSSTQITTSIRELIRGALIAGAYGIILAHNHPHGNTTPSSGDIGVTKQFKTACSYHDIILVDHVICNPSGHVTSIMESIGDSKTTTLSSQQSIQAVPHKTHDKINFLLKAVIAIGLSLIFAYSIGYVIYAFIHSYDLITSSPLILGGLAFTAYIFIIIIQRCFNNLIKM